VGLGDIGRGLASAVAAAGLPLAVLDVRTEATEPFADRGRICTTPAEIGRLSEVLLVSVVTDEQVLSVVEGALPAMPPGSAVVVVSTVKLETVEQVADLAARAGVGVVDCGVSGGPVAAAEGVLVSMVGGDDGAVERARPAIEAFSSVVVRMGPLGSGQRAKLARNLIQYGSWYAAHEGMRLAEAAGIPLTKLAKVVRESDAHIGGASRLMFRSTTAPFTAEDDAGIVAAMAAGAALAHKDLAAALDLAGQLGIDLPLAGLTASHVDDVFGLGSG
jgi:3-hydroxyisobutyrate dehydrogenase